MSFIPQNLVTKAQTGTTYTFVEMDRAKLLTFHNVTTNATAAYLPNFENGWLCYVQNLCDPNNDFPVGTVALVPTGGATINGNPSFGLLPLSSGLLSFDGTNFHFNVIDAKAFPGPFLGGSSMVTSGSGYGTNSGVAFPVTENQSATHVQITSNVLTITVPNTYQVNDAVQLSSFATNTFLNGSNVVVLTATGTQFTANFTNANVNTADTGTVSRSCPLYLYSTRQGSSANNVTVVFDTSSTHGSMFSVSGDTITVYTNWDGTLHTVANVITTFNATPPTTLSGGTIQALTSIALSDVDSGSGTAFINTNYYSLDNTFGWSNNALLGVAWFNVTGFTFASTNGTFNLQGLGHSFPAVFPHAVTLVLTNPQPIQGGSGTATLVNTSIVMSSTNFSNAGTTTTQRLGNENNGITGMDAASAGTIAVDASFQPADSNQSPTFVLGVTGGTVPIVSTFVPQNAILTAGATAFGSSIFGSTVAQLFPDGQLFHGAGGSAIPGSASRSNAGQCFIQNYSCPAQPATVISLTQVAIGPTFAVYYGANTLSFFQTGTQVTITGFTNASNNGTFTITNFTDNWILVENGIAIAETHAGTATIVPINTTVGQFLSLQYFNASGVGTPVTSGQSITGLSVFPNVEDGLVDTVGLVLGVQVDALVGEGSVTSTGVVAGQFLCQSHSLATTGKMETIYGQLRFIRGMTVSGNAANIHLDAPLVASGSGSATISGTYAQLLIESPENANISGTAYAIKVNGGVSQFTGLASAIVTKVANYTATLDDHTINCTGTFTITLPTVGLVVGQEFYIKNIGTGVTTVSSAVNIDAATSLTIPVQYNSITVQWDGTQYWIY